MRGEIVVVAGTPYDSQLGADMLQARGLAARPVAMAASPDGQDIAQDQHPDVLLSSFLDLLAQLEKEGTAFVVLFCNSLSAVLGDVQTHIPVISPLTLYREILPRWRSSLVVAGNAHALLGLERTARSVAPTHSMLGVSAPALVRDIEHGDPIAAFESSHLPTALHSAQTLGLDAVILACTHFTSIAPQVTAACSLPIIDIGTLLIDHATEMAQQQSATGSKKT